MIRVVIGSALARIKRAIVTACEGCDDPSHRPGGGGPAETGTMMTIMSPLPQPRETKSPPYIFPYTIHTYTCGCERKSDGSIRRCAWHESLIAVREWRAVMPDMDQERMERGAKAG